MRTYKPSEFISGMLHSTGIVNIKSKKCVACGEDKDINDFSKDSKCIDGHRAKCKSCVAKRSAELHSAKKKEKDYWNQFSAI